MSKDKPWRTLSSNIVYQNPWLTIREDKIVTPGGTKGIYGIVEIKEGVVVIAESDTGVYLQRSYRYPMQSWQWELPTGGIDPGDTPLICAQKELAEEMGLTADDWLLLGTMGPSNNSAMHDQTPVFLARNLRPTNTKHEAGEAIRDIQPIPTEELFEMVMKGEIKDGQTIAALLYYKLWLEQDRSV